MSQDKYCRLLIRNKADSALNLVLQGTNVKVVRAMRIRCCKRLRLERGTYVMEAWLNRGRIHVEAQNIPHLSVEKISSRDDVSLRGRKIVADFVNKRARLQIEKK